ncbi:MAG: thioredoxin [Byssovorax sp.]
MAMTRAWMKVGAIALAIAAGGSAGCKVDEPAPTKVNDAPPATAQGGHAVEIVKAAGGEVAPAVKAELVRARGANKRLLVYVGATWCEPCQRFHDAAAKGELDTVFPDLRLLEFDLDRDKEALERAGYASRMIPLFALPNEDGTGSGQQIEGSIKGPGAVAQIRPRLTALLAKGK